MNHAISYFRKMLLDAQKGGYAVGAFNIENMEMVKAVLAAAEELKAPVMLQTTPGTIKYGTVETYAAIVKAEAEKVSVPVCLHLDHGNSFELAVQAMHAGYTSVMIDGSGEDFESNIALTKKVVDVAKALGIPVEAELGKVGGKGRRSGGGCGHKYRSAGSKKNLRSEQAYPHWL